MPSLDLSQGEGHHLTCASRLRPIRPISSLASLAWFGLKMAMQLLAAISFEQAKELSKFNFDRGSRLHILLPALFFGMALTIIIGREYYKEWRRKRRLRRYWDGKGSRP